MDAKKKNSVILCEGFSDLVILRCALEKAGWKKLEGTSWEGITQLFPDSSKETDEYTNDNDNLLTVHSVGGCENFAQSVLKVFKYNRNEFTFSALAIVTDNDDNKAISRFDKILKEVSASDAMFADMLKGVRLDDGKPHTIKVYDKERDAEGLAQDTQIGYDFTLLGLLLPPDEHGAIETFILDRLANDSAEKGIINKVKNFIDKDTHVHDFLEKRGKRTKAKLSVTFSLFFPNRMFDDMIEYLKRIPFENYQELTPMYNLIE